MPESRKRKIEKKEVSASSKYNIAEKTSGKILIVILCISMFATILFASIYLMIEYLTK